MIGNQIKKHMFRHHHMKCLNKAEKVCLAGIITLSFMKGICIGMYLGRK